MDLGLGVYEETEVDGDFNEVGLEPLMTTTTSVVEERLEGKGEQATASGGEQQALPSRHGGEPLPPGAASWNQPSPPFGEAPAPYQPASSSGFSEGYSGGSSPDVEQAGKLFLGGISWQTDEKQLHSHFSNYGELVDVAVMRNKSTGISRGFAFITFRNPESAETVLSIEHNIDGRRIDIKHAVPRDRAPPAVDRGGGRGTQQVGASSYGPSGGSAPHYQQPSPVHDSMHATGYGPPVYANGQVETRKLFVGGLPASVSDPEFRGYFERFGAVDDAVVMFDKTTLRSRGFGFVTFASIESSRAVLSQQHELQGKYVEVKCAEPKEAISAKEAAISAHHSAMHHGHNNYPPQQQQYDHHAAMAAQQHHYAAAQGASYGAPQHMDLQRPDAVYHDARTGMPLSTQHGYPSMPGGPPSHYHEHYHHAYPQHYGQPQQAQQPMAQTAQDMAALEQQQHYATQQRYDNGQAAAMGDAYAAGYPGQSQQPYGYPPPPPKDGYGGYRGQGGGGGGGPRNRDRGYRGGYNG